MNKVGSLKNKKSQEEIVGFVVVIVLIAVIALVFLGLSLTKKQEPIESRQVSNLLGAMLQYTTDCSVYKPAYETFRKRPNAENLLGALRQRGYGKLVDELSKQDIGKLAKYDRELLN